MSVFDKVGNMFKKNPPSQPKNIVGTGLEFTEGAAIGYGAVKIGKSVVETGKMKKELEAQKKQLDAYVEAETERIVREQPSSNSANARATQKHIEARQKAEDPVKKIMSQWAPVDDEHTIKGIEEKHPLLLPFGDDF